MSKLAQGLLAGAAGTAAMSAVMIMKGAMGVMPELNAIHMMATMAEDLTGLAIGAPGGWAMHAMIGIALWGGLFGLIHDRLPGPTVARGVGLAVGAWLMMMVAVMPMAGAGLFGLGLGLMAPMATLMLHVVYGVALGKSFGYLDSAPIMASVEA